MGPMSLVKEALFKSGEVEIGLDLCYHHREREDGKVILSWFVLRRGWIVGWPATIKWEVREED